MALDSSLPYNEKAKDKETLFPVSNLDEFGKALEVELDPLSECGIEMRGIMGTFWKLRRQCKNELTFQKEAANNMSKLYDEQRRFNVSLQVQRNTMMKRAREYKEERDVLVKRIKVCEAETESYKKGMSLIERGLACINKKESNVEKVKGRTCPICYNDDTELKWAALTCGHVFCCNCIISLNTCEELAGRCPTCKQYVLYESGSYKAVMLYF